jgi:GT2 family glycosyltransferase
MAFRRRILSDIGGFDPLFGPGALFPACEEIEAVGRASAMGWKGAYHPEVVVRHHHGRKAADAAALWKSYAIGRGAYHMKLLLKGRQFWWFARSVYQLRWRYKPSRGTVFWEQVGAMRYVYIYFTERFRSGRRRVSRLGSKLTN